MLTLRGARCSVAAEGWSAMQRAVPCSHHYKHIPTPKKTILAALIRQKPGVQSSMRLKKKQQHNRIQAAQPHLRSKPLTPGTLLCSEQSQQTANQVRYSPRVGRPTSQRFSSPSMWLTFPRSPALRSSPLWCWGRVTPLPNLHARAPPHPQAAPHTAPAGSSALPTSCCHGISSGRSSCSHTQSNHQLFGMSQTNPPFNRGCSA